MLLLAERVRPALDGLESNEGDPERVGLLYDIDHGVSRMRCLAREIQVLTGQGTDEVGMLPASLLDVVRAAASGVEYYDRLYVGPVADRTLAGHAADDVASLLAVLLDNATRCSSSPVRIDTRSSGDGSLLVRIEDNGPGMDPAWAEALNRMFAGPVPPMSAVNGRRTGFAVAHRLARKHEIGLALVCRRAVEATHEHAGKRGTVAMVAIPPRLLCDVPGPVRPSESHPRPAACGKGLTESSEPFLMGRASASSQKDPFDRLYVDASFADDVAAFTGATSTTGSSGVAGSSCRPGPASTGNRPGGATT